MIHHWLNRVFGIENQISVPILVSVIIFITGGVSQLFFKSIGRYISRWKTRETFYALLNITQKDISQKEKNIYKFYPKFNIEHKGNWKLDYNLIGYLQNILSLDFQEVYFAFRKKRNIFFWKYKEKDKSFHLIWQSLNNLNFIENRIESELMNFQSSFNRYNQNYNNSLSAFRTFFEDSDFKNLKLERSEENQKTFDYLVDRQKIWHKWLKIGEVERIGYYSTFNHLVLPNIELNKKYSGLELVKVSDAILVDLLHQYQEMENCLDFYKSKFYSLYLQYRISRRRINICIKSLKKCT
jgi:hypothetical protein